MTLKEDSTMLITKGHFDMFVKQIKILDKKIKIIEKEINNMSDTIQDLENKTTWMNTDQN